MVPAKEFPCTCIKNKENPITSLKILRLIGVNGWIVFNNNDYIGVHIYLHLSKSIETAANGCYTLLYAQIMTSLFTFTVQKYILSVCQEHAGSFCVSVILRTVTWTTRSLTGICNRVILMYDCGKRWFLWGDFRVECVSQNSTSVNKYVIEKLEDMAHVMINWSAYFSAVENPHNPLHEAVKDTKSSRLGRGKSWMGQTEQYYK